ncbi:ABC transporter permease [Salinibacterium sp. UTAS2018]|uniref:ABC transporter permease n=1 Tax=unclassified Salinibacterium TaxID=2632331 RepID=UPI00100951C0|nr:MULTISPECIES: ABC transporter permease [unclassified Salinibacterium]MBH0007871.1 ABC transporter permease [Salinibacterium sp. SWN1162]QAV70783.1 ABC transporter permease [Salinibacterium sp. UTAS2018]
MTTSTTDPTLAPDGIPIKRSRWLPARKRLPAAWRRPLAVVGIFVIVSWTVIAIFAPWVAPHDPLAQDFDRYLPPSGDHPFGTDVVGRDILSRVIYGARVSLPLAVLLVTLSVIVGATVGAIAGYVGGVVDAALMRVVDLFFAFPAIILAMAVAASLGPSLTNAVLAIVIVSWPAYARVTRSLVLSLRETNYLAASRLLGDSSAKALVKEVMPNVAGPVLVLASLELGNAVLLLSGLSFLGLGAVPPEPEWGSMVSSGAAVFYNYWVALFPGLAIFTVVLGFNFLGDAMRDALDPRSARSVATSEL